MKNFAKFLAVALVIAVVASAFIVLTSAASPAGDPKELKVASENVVFIMDPDADGNYPGDGSGSSAENPLIPVDHEDFDPEDDNPKKDLQTAWYQATEMLKPTGGTIVICGPVRFNADNSYGSGVSQRDVRTAGFGKNVIKITSVYNGVDYRETNGACIELTAPAQLSISGSTIWENVKIGTASTARVICFEHYPTLVGAGVECYPTDSVFEGVASNYISLAGGKRYGKGVDVMPTLTVQSGTYNKVVAGMWGVSATTVMDPATTYLTLEGTTKVLGNIIGTVGQTSPFGGNVNITINDGTYECDISAVGPTGMTNTDGVALIKINGGNFESLWSISPTSMGMLNNPAATAILDFSSWTGELQQLAYAYAANDTTFTKVNLPEGVTAEQLEGMLGGSSVEDTTEAVVDETDAPVANEDEETKAPAKDEKDEETQAAVGVGNEGSSNTGLIIAIVVAAVVVVAAAAVVVVVVLKKKK